MAKQTVFTILNLILVALCPVTASAQEPVLYSATYRAVSSGLSATAHRSLTKIAEHQFELENNMDVKVLGVRLGRVKESSRFHWQDNELVADTYLYSQTGISGKREQAVFDWDRNLAISTEDDESWELPISPGIIDKLGFQFLLASRLQHTSDTEFEFQIVDANEVKNQLYRVIGREIVETTLGSFNTIKVERIREGDSKRNTLFWLAEDHQMLLIKFIQISGSGSKTELILKEAVVDGQVLILLP